jgi:hypothetical protein
VKPVRLVDLRILLEAACGVALALALLMPFFTVSAQNYIPVKAVTSITDAIPQEPLADLFVAVAALALILSVLRVLRPASGLLLMLLSLASFVAAGVLVAILQLQWSDATSGWQMDAARFLGVEFSHSFGFWVYLGAAVIGGGLVLTELASRLSGRPAMAVNPSFHPPAGSLSQPLLGAAWAAGGDAPSAPVPVREAYAQSMAPIMRAPADVAAGAAGAGRVVVVESGRSTAVVVALGQSVLLGRDAGCGVRLTDPRVSRRHTSIERVSGGWVVRDLGATNPTRLLQSGGTSSEVGPGVRVPLGQLLVGDVLVTLYP